MKIQTPEDYAKAQEELKNPYAELIMNAQGLRDQMLEYRRANNIYENGDTVVLRNTPHLELFTFVKHFNCGSPYSVLVDNNLVTFYIGNKFIDHAKPEEIKAGYRQ